jgi:chromosome partitioning protein
MILAVGNVKGGVGKTTLAINVAIARANAGQEVLLVDGDEQQTAMTFTQLRSEQLEKTGYTAVSLQGAVLRTQVRQLAPKYHEVVIDVGGRDTGSLRAALTVADTFLIPVQPRTFNIWALDQMAALVKEAREINPELRAVSILNAADSQGRDNAEAAEALKDVSGIAGLPVMIGRRKVFPNAASTGRGVAEYLPKNPKALREFQQLLTLLYTDTISE